MLPWRKNSTCPFKWVSVKGGLNVSDIDFHFLSVAELLLSFKRKDTGISSKK